LKASSFGSYDKKNQVFLDVPPWQLENSGQRFGGPCCIQLQGPIKPWIWRWQPALQCW